MFFVEGKNRQHFWKVSMTNQSMMFEIIDEGRKKDRTFDIDSNR
jgi:hypothetical protein